MPKPEKVATPEFDVALPVPTTVPLDSDAVTNADDVVTTLLPASCTCTTGWVAKAWPYLAVAALVVSTSFVAAPTPTLKLLDVWEVNPDEANVSV